MWICTNCGETNVVMPGVCSVCAHPRTTDRELDVAPARWEPPSARSAPPLPAPWEPTPASREPITPPEPPPRPRTARADPPEPPATPAAAPPGPAFAGVPSPEPPGPTVGWIPERADRPVVWIPEPAEPIAPGTLNPEPLSPEPLSPEPPRRSRLVPALPVAVLVAALTAAALLAGPRLLRSEADARPTAAASPTTRPPAPRPTPTIESAPARLVLVDTSVTDPRAAGVAAMFETYFTGINQKDYETVAEVFDPSGELDPGDPEQMAAFSDGTATARDSDVVLRRLTRTGGGRMRAVVTFRSDQEAGDGPEERPAETCTLWRVTYTISGDEGEYRIVRGDGTSRPC